MILLLLLDTALDAAPIPALPDISFGWLFAKTVIAMVVVIFGAFFFIKFILPRLQFGHRASQSRIQVIDKLGLEARKALYIIGVGRKRILIGSGEQGLSKLADLELEDVEDIEA